MRVKLATGLPGLEAQNILANGVNIGTKGFIILTEAAGASNLPSCHQEGGITVTPLAHPASVTPLRQISPDWHS